MLPSPSSSLWGTCLLGPCSSSYFSGPGVLVPGSSSSVCGLILLHFYGALFVFRVLLPLYENLVFWVLVLLRLLNVRCLASRCPIECILNASN